jgi:hypothetical protein
MVRRRFPDGEKSWSYHRSAKTDGKPSLAAEDRADAANMVAVSGGENGDETLKLRGEFGRIRMLQGRLDEADRLLSPVFRAADPQSPDFAKLVLNYAEVLHRLHRDAEAIVVLDSIEAVLEKHPGLLDDVAVEAAKLRVAIVRGK